MVTLEEIRKHIDDLDSRIVGLLDERARAGRQAGEIKKKLGQPLHSPGREQEVLARLARLSDGSMPVSALEAVYRVLMSETLKLEVREQAPRHGVATGDAAGKTDVQAEIVENLEAAPGFFRMRLRAPALANVFRPGQFFQLRLGNGASSPFLRRPFAPSEMLADGFRFVYAVVGSGTRTMADLPTGTLVDILAPLGNSYSPLPAGAGALLIGGGCGAPSLAPLARALRRDGVRTTVLIGARTSSMLLEQETFAALADRLVVATDDGSCGCRGTTVDAYRLDEKVRDGKYDRVYACGPVPMLRAAAKLAEELGVGCEVSLEERMACGFGACVGCAVPVLEPKVEAGFVYRRVCHEGPVFDAKTLAWDRMK